MTLSHFGLPSPPRSSSFLRTAGAAPGARNALAAVAWTTTSATRPSPCHAPFPFISLFVALSCAGFRVVASALSSLSAGLCSRPSGRGRLLRWAGAGRQQVGGSSSS